MTAVMRAVMPATGPKVLRVGIVQDGGVVEERVIRDRSAPAQPKPKLPLAVKGGFKDQVDWPLTIIVALSFLLHFGLVGGMYSDWMDPVVDDGIVVGNLIDISRTLLPAPQVPVEDPVAATPRVASSSAPVATPAPNGGAPTRHPGDSKDKGAVSDARASALAARASDLQMSLLMALGPGSALQDALHRVDIPPVDLSGAAASDTGASTTTGNSLHLDTSSGPVRPGASHSGLSGLGDTRGAAAATAGPESNVRPPPSGTVDLGPTTSTVAVSNAERIVAGLRPAFRRCYDRGLASDPGMSGKVLVAARIAPNGEVASADAPQNTGLSTAVVECILKRVRSAQFDGPGPNGATLQIPVTFVRQGE
jgi:hypothetical protein